MTTAAVPAVLTERERRFRTTLERELGATIGAKLRDSTVTNLGILETGRLWYEAAGEGLVVLDERMAPDQVRALLATVANFLGVELTAEAPLLDGELPYDGSRVSACIPPVTTAPTLTIRTHHHKTIPLESYLASGALSLAHAEAVRRAIGDRQNVVISGATNSGKTTFANAVLSEIVTSAPEHRYLVLEDTRELHCAATNVLSLRTTLEISMRKLLAKSLRERPDRILIGEVRGAEALDLLKAWNTGHPGGLCTLHANNTRAALIRLDSLVQEAGVPPQRALIAETVGLLVHLGFARGRRQVLEVARLRGLDAAGDFVLELV